MERYYDNGAIVVKTHLFDKVTYHVANYKFNAIFTGNGTIASYDIANESKIAMDFFLAIFHNGAPLHDAEKTVYMQGRKQVIDIKWGDNLLKITMFLDRKVNGVFTKCEFFGKGDIKLCLCGGGAFIGLNAKSKNLFVKESFAFATTANAEYISDNLALYFDIKAGESFNLFYSYGENGDSALEFASRLDEYLELLHAEINSIKLPAQAVTEEQKAFFYSAYFCALENYKELGEYKGFMAGYNYIDTMRTYYRDSYYTVLPMYNGHTDLVKAQILTLTRGVAPNGDCPSAVAYGFEGWWGNHYDSPSFLAIMLYDYVRYTKDCSILSQSIDGLTVFERAELVVKKLASFADDTNLLFKDGKFNKRDWADAINRYGYVSYDNILYARALYSLSKLAEILSLTDKANEYLTAYERVKNAINELLWSDELGYYINYKNDDYTESNLSVDTVWAVIFGIADKERSMRMLKNMERLLETKNNAEQKGGDYGVMCVYPFYSQPLAVYHKSSLPYCYHNGGNWPYLSSIYAYAKKKMGLEYEYALYSWFDANVQKGNYTPIEYYSSMQRDGSMLQAWSGVGAFVQFDENCDFYD